LNATIPLSQFLNCVIEPVCVLEPGWINDYPYLFIALFLFNYNWELSLRNAIYRINTWLIGR
jgi:hypothetical protein